MKTLKFNPTTFLGKGWTIESDNGFNPADLSGITLKHFLQEGESYITGEEIVKRLGNDKSLNADAFLRLWENQDLIPKEWYEPATKGYIEFTGTFLRSSDGYRCFLCLYRRDGGSWYWYCSWLASDRNRGSVSPVSASSTQNLSTSPSDPLTLALGRIQRLEDNVAALVEWRDRVQRP